MIKIFKFIFKKLKDFKYKRRFIKALKQDVLYSKWRETHSLLEKNYRNEVLKNFIKPRSSFDLKHHVLDNFKNTLNINTDYINTFWSDEDE